MKPILYYLCLGLLLGSCGSRVDSPLEKPAESASSSLDSAVIAKRALPGVKMITIDGGFQVFTRKMGEGPIKVLLLHGGPAMTHEYMECFDDFFPEAGIEYYQYDQLGSYYSDQPQDSALWDLDRFVEEVEQVRQAWGLDSTNFYILGNSWGGLLGIEYALKYQHNLKGLIVANMVASIPRYAEYNAVLRSAMRPGLLDTLAVYEAAEDYHNPEYQELVFNEYYTKHLCRLDPWPDPVLRSLEHINQTVYELMQGPSEFKVGGRLLHWDRWEDLSKITVPTLMVGAKYDTMDPKQMEAMAKEVVNGTYLYCPNGSHLAMWDDQQIFMDGVIQFINETSK